MTTTESRRECNKCGKSKLSHKFKHEDKKTCLKCEFRWKQRILRRMAYTTKLSPYQKVASRVGYMGSGFLIAAQWSLDPKLYILGFIAVMIQTSSRKQWNLVVLNLNGLAAWIMHLINN